MVRNTSIHGMSIHEHYYCTYLYLLIANSANIVNAVYSFILLQISMITFEALWSTKYPSVRRIDNGVSVVGYAT